MVRGNIKHQRRALKVKLAVHGRRVREHGLIRLENASTRMHMTKTMQYRFDTFDSLRQRMATQALPAA